MNALGAALGLALLGGLFIACTPETARAPGGHEGAAEAADQHRTRGDGGPATLAPQPKEVQVYDLHGRAGYFKVHIFERPDMDSPRLGYLRKGRETMVGDPDYRSESCPKGWFKLPEGGFVCQGRGMLVGSKTPFLPRVPPEPRVDELDPYGHGFVRSDWTPVYMRLPGADDLWKPPSVDDLAAGQETEPVEGPSTEPLPEPLDPDAGPEEPEIVPHSEDGSDGGLDYYRYTKERFKNVRTLIPKGFWIAFGERRQEEQTGLYYYETVKGDFVPADAVHPVSPPDFKGYEIHGDTPLPAVIVEARNATFFTEYRGRLRRSGTVERLASYRVYETKKRSGATFHRIPGDRWLRADQTVYFALREPPPDLGVRDKWIRIDLSRQTLEAYQGPTPVYATLISSGLPDSEETLTPTGRFRVKTKHLTDDMSGTVGDDEAYSVDDVPWVQYLHLNIALHAAFWHNQYGRPKSHGCINLSPRDARWLFNWTDPPLPAEWHGVIAGEASPGTLVIIEGKTPGEEPEASRAGSRPKTRVR